MKSMAEGATIEVWNAQHMRYERTRVIRVRNTCEKGYQYWRRTVAYVWTGV